MRAASPDRVKRDVGRRISELRRALGSTQEALAEMAGVSLKYVQRVEAGRENMTLETIVKFANLLRAVPEALFEAPKSRVTRPGRPPSRTRSTRLTE
jgi:transcriptional regulator with XRE-family HTH domain